MADHHNHCCHYLMSYSSGLTFIILLCWIILVINILVFIIAMVTYSITPISSFPPSPPSTGMELLFGGMGWKDTWLPSIRKLPLLYHGQSHGTQVCKGYTLLGVLVALLSCCLVVTPPGWMLVMVLPLSTWTWTLLMYPTPTLFPTKWSWSHNVLM